jgi:hypothetical protein
MPYQSCRLPKGRQGTKWGHRGRCYPDKKDADKQRKAIKASQAFGPYRTR